MPVLKVTTANATILGLISLCFKYDKCDFDNCQTKRGQLWEALNTVEQSLQAHFFLFFKIITYAGIEFAIASGKDFNSGNALLKNNQVFE